MEMINVMGDDIINQIAVVDIFENGIHDYSDAEEIVTFDVRETYVLIELGKSEREITIELDQIQNILYNGSGSYRILMKSGTIYKFTKIS